MQLEALSQQPTRRRRRQDGHWWLGSEQQHPSAATWATEQLSLGSALLTLHGQGPRKGGCPCHESHARGRVLDRPLWPIKQHSPLLVPPKDIPRTGLMRGPRKSTDVCERRTMPTTLYSAARPQLTCMCPTQTQDDAERLVDAKSSRDQELCGQQRFPAVLLGNQDNLRTTAGISAPSSKQRQHYTPQRLCWNSWALVGTPWRAAEQSQ
uniref:Uncharacterized protein n=1 Tax=Gouania willdenowi TaxID=441366 RepID=A0A8C5HWR4_GOUWI